MNAIVVTVFQQYYVEVTYIARQGIKGDGLHNQEDALRCCYGNDSGHNLIAHDGCQLVLISLHLPPEANDSLAIVRVVVSCTSRSVQGLESSLVGTKEVTRERETEKRERYVRE